jgi:Rieske Fe-S protein
MENSVPQHTITDWTTLDNNYKNQVALHPGQPLDPIDAINNGKNAFASFFYWPYDSSTSPYYKDVLVRLPDTNPDGSPLLATPDSKIFTAPNGARFVAFNTTCVHLRCLVNPGNPVANEYRLLCPCHGSQYRLVDGIPVAGPAYDLGLKPLPQVNLDFSKGNNTVVAVIWGRNPDGSPIFLNGVPGIGRG